jgi:hypothetical protein
MAAPPPAAQAAAHVALVLPIFRRVWLQHVCRTAASAAPTPPAWQTGKTAQEKAHLLAAHAQHWAAGKVDKQWHAIQTAPEGTINSYIFK